MLRRRVAFRVFDDEQRSRADERLGGIEGRRQFGGAVRRIQEQDVDGVGGQLPVSTRKRRADNSIAVGDAAALEVRRR